MDEGITELESRLSQETSPSKKAEILLELGKRYLPSDLSGAKKLALQALALAKRSKEKKILGEIFNFYANICRLRGENESAISYCQKALKIAEVTNDRSIKAVAYRILGLLHQAKGNLDTALYFHEQDLMLSRELNDEDGVALAYNNLSLVYWEKGNLSEALAWQKKSLAIKEAKGKLAAAAVSRINMGVIYEDMGKWDESLECFYRALAEKERLKDIAGVALCYNNIGEIYLKRGKLAKAIALFETAITFAEKAGSPLRKAEALGNMGEANFLSQNFLRAMNLYVEAMEIATKIEVKDELARTYRRMGELFLRENPKEAEDFLEKALKLTQEIGVKKEEGNVQRVRGKLFGKLKKREEAKSCFQASCEILKSLGAQYELAKTYLEFGKFLTENYGKEFGLSYLHEAEGIFKELEISAESEDLEKYLYRLERDEDKGVAFLRGLSTLAANPSPIPDFCPRCLALLKDTLLLSGCSLKIGNHLFALGEIKEGEGISLPLSLGREESGTLTLKFQVSPPFPFHDPIKATLTNILSLGLEKALSLTAPRLEKLEEERGLPFDGIIGKNEKVLSLFALIKKVAPTKVSVLIQGESGTGKELIARLIHKLSPQAKGPFVAINCAAIPETLLESELFGVEKGAATGVTEKEGRFQMSDGGTLLLDEIAEMSLSLQAKILRVIQEKKFEKVGGKKTIAVDVRIIAATNQDLEKCVREKKFREDLFYRLNVVSLTLPPLRERREDIPLLTQYFLEKFNKEFQKSCRGVSPEVMDKFLTYPWPGNIRELENVIERALILAQGEEITLSDLPPIFSELPTPSEEKKPLPLKEKRKREVDASERSLLNETLKATDWDIPAAAQKLGISQRHLYRLIKKYDLRRIQG